MYKLEIESDYKFAVRHKGTVHTGYIVLEIESFNELIDIRDNLRSSLGIEPYQGGENIKAWLMDILKDKLDDYDNNADCKSIRWYKMEETVDVTPRIQPYTLGDKPTELEMINRKLDIIMEHLKCTI